MSPFARANLVAPVRELEAGGQVDPFAAFGDERRGQVDSTPGRWEPARIRVDAYGSRIDAVAALERRHRLAALCPSLAPTFRTPCGYRVFRVLRFRVST